MLVQWLVLIHGVTATWIALGSNATLLGSENGVEISWSRVAASGRFNAVAFAPPPLSLWCAVGRGADTIQISKSTGAKKFLGLGARVFTVEGVGIVWGNHRFVAVGSGGNGIATSTDGVNWMGLGVDVLSSGSAAAEGSSFSSSSW